MYGIILLLLFLNELFRCIFSPAVRFLQYVVFAEEEEEKKKFIVLVERLIHSVVFGLRRDGTVSYVTTFIFFRYFTVDFLFQTLTFGRCLVMFLFSDVPNKVLVLQNMDWMKHLTVLPLHLTKIQSDHHRKCKIKARRCSETLL